MDFQLNRDQLDLQKRAEAVGASFRGEAREWDESDNAPYNDIFERIRAADLLGIAMPTEYGGQGGGAIEYLVVVEALFRNAQSWLPPSRSSAPAAPAPRCFSLVMRP